MSAAANLEADLAKMAQRVIGHMNDDHPDSLLAYAHYYAGLYPAAKAAKMVGLTAAGFELDVTLADGTVRRRVLVPYDPPLAAAAHVRKVAVAMHFGAFNGMGLGYKCRHGFYSGAARQAWAHMPPRARLAVAGIGLSVLSALAYAGLRVARRLR